MTEAWTQDIFVHPPVVWGYSKLGSRLPNFPNGYETPTFWYSEVRAKSIGRFLPSGCISWPFLQHPCALNG